MDGFLSVMDFSCVSWSTPCSSLSDPWYYRQTPCVSANFFPVCYVFLPVIHSWACVHQCSIFRVVDVLCAVCYTAAKYEWIFLSIVDFPMCHCVYPFTSLSNP